MKKLISRMLILSLIISTVFVSNISFVVDAEYYGNAVNYAEQSADILNGTHYVTVDGVKHSATDGVFITPENGDSSFVGYFDGTKLIDGNARLDVTEDITLQSVNLPLEMLKGASIRFSNPTGIRYYTNIDKEALDNIEALGAAVQLGTLICPKDILGFEELTLDLQSEKINVLFNSRDWFTEEDFSGFVGSITNIKTGNINREFVGRGYATITLGDYTKTVYADYSEKTEKNNKRTICYIANCIKNSDSYSNLADFKKKIVDSFANEYFEEVGVTDDNYPMGNVKRYGAVGDGIADDTIALQNAISNNKNRKIVFGDNETYNVHGGFLVDKNIEIEGNGSTILISKMNRDDKDFFLNRDNEKENNGVGIFAYQLFMPRYNEYSTDKVSENWVFKNFKIDWQVQDEVTGLGMSTDNKPTTYFIFRNYDVNTLTFENVDFNIEGNDKNSIQILTCTAQSDKVLVNNCNFTNKIHGYFGSCIWIQAFKANGYKDVTISNCNFYQESRDEIISTWGCYSKNLQIENCKFERNCVACYKADGTEGASNDVILTVNQTKTSSENESLSSTTHIANYSNCEFNVYGDNTPGTFIQMYSAYGAKTECVFDNCTMNIETKTGIISGETIANVTAIEDNNEFSEKCRIIFKKSDCTFISPSIPTTRSVNFAFEDCKITKNTQLADLTYVNSRIISCWRGTFINNEIELNNISGNEAVLFKNLSEGYNNVIDFEGNTVVCRNTEGEKTDSIENYSVNPNQIPETAEIRHSLNAKSEYIFKDNTFN